MQESALAARFPSLDPDSLEMVRDVFLTIDGAYFPVGVEADLYQAVMDASRLIYGPATDYEAVWKEKLSAAAGKAWKITIPRFWNSVPGWKRGWYYEKAEQWIFAGGSGLTGLSGVLFRTVSDHLLVFRFLWDRKTGVCRAGKLPGDL